MSRKQDILDAATRLFAVNGFTKTTTAELAKLIGIAEGTVFYHFKNKETLFMAVLSSVREEILREFREYEARHSFGDGMHMLEGVVGFYLYLSATMEDAFLLLHRHFPYRMAMENQVCREHLEAIYNCLVDLFEQAILRGLGDGSMVGVNPRKAALLVFTMVDGVARFKTYNLYNAGALVDDLLAACQRMLGPGVTAELENA